MAPGLGGGCRLAALAARPSPVAGAYGRRSCVLQEAFKAPVRLLIPQQADRDVDCHRRGGHYRCTYSDHEER